jgi:hypothetical protein
LRRTTCLVFVALVVLAAVPAATATATAAPRMPIGFFDDPSFRWSPQRAENLAAAKAAGSSIIHTTADWSQIAPTKPKFPDDVDDPAYRLNDLDELVRNAAQFGQQVMINISGTPRWANGNQPPNVPPKNLRDLTTFARILALRYNGQNPGKGSVSRWSVWNEPNLEQFLKPQFRGKTIVSPAAYAKIYKAAYAGIKLGNPLAQVAIGETSNRGRDKPLAGESGTVAPGTFARLLGRIPGLKFDAWATHPYPTVPSLGPSQQVAWPNVTMLQLPRFEQQLRASFHRRVPIWITEYGQQTKPEKPQGVTRAKQAVFAKQALTLAKNNPDVEMFIWFILRDSNAKTWKSGLIGTSGARKPAYAAFSATARLLDGQTAYVRAGSPPLVKVYVPYMAYQNQSRNVVGITYRVYNGTSLVAIGQPSAPLGADESVSFVADFTPARGKQYTLTADVNDQHGNHETRSVVIVAT